MVGCGHPGHRHPEHGDAAEDDVGAVVAEAIKTMRAQGMRRTRLVEELVRMLAGAPGPLTITAISEGLHGHWDLATLYRTVDRLVQAGVVRRIGLQDRAMYHDLTLSGRHRDYLLCTGCGAIGDVATKCPVAELEAAIVQRTGYAMLRHDLLFYGRCPECQAEEAEGQGQ